MHDNHKWKLVAAVVLAVATTEVAAGAVVRWCRKETFTVSSTQV